MEEFINASFGAVDIASTPENATQPASFLLEQNCADEGNGTDELSGRKESLRHNECRE